MKKIHIFPIFFLFFNIILPSTRAQNAPAVIPQPVHLTTDKGQLVLRGTVAVIVPKGQPQVRQVAKMWMDKMSEKGLPCRLSAVKTPGQPYVVFAINPSLKKEWGTEGYRLETHPDRILLEAAAPAGLFYAYQSLLQLFPPQIYSNDRYTAAEWVLPLVRIEDRPRYRHRGMHLDVARHFQPVAFVKRYIDFLALHKMNTFHWHLTDDQGWRIEIKKYPKLTQIGSKRAQTLIGHYSRRPVEYDKTPHEGFYTQTEIREVVAYAAARHINIIPEIEMPGHALAALAAYPEYSCQPERRYVPAETWGVFNDVFCPSDTTFKFLEDVLTEVIALFPSKYIHIGGDECPKEAWKNSSFCQELMKKQGLKDEEALQSYFIRRIERFVNSKGRRIIGWDEILEGGLAPNATVMSWRGTEGGIAAAREGHDVIMSPGSHCYFDHYQAEATGEPLAIGGFTPLEKVYAYEPTPEVLSATEAQHILGAQANVWTEYLPTAAGIEYMILPRMSALSEVLWSPKHVRQYDRFVDKLTQAQFQRFEALKARYAKRVYDISIDIQPLTAGSTAKMSLTSLAKKGQIRYNLNGQTPSVSDPIFTEMVTLDHNVSVQAALFEGNTRVGEASRVDWQPNPCYGRPITFAQAPTRLHAAGTQGLTNGRYGQANSWSQWIAFEGQDMVATLDMSAPTQLKSLNIQFLNAPDSWIFLPEYVLLSVSNDGLTWSDVDRVDFGNGLDNSYKNIETAHLRLSEYTTAKRYYRITAKNRGKGPAKHPSEGHKVWLFADEIEANKP